MRGNAALAFACPGAVRRVVLASGFAVGLYAVRVARTGDFTFGFLLWNLTLALVPYALALPRRGGAPRMLAWLLFFPNAPYIVTDLIHLRPRAVPYWFDVLMLAAFAWAGLVSGCLSLQRMHARVDARHGTRIGWAFVAAVALASGLGIWLGRFVRLNSWDVVANPGALFEAVSVLVLHPLDSIQAWGVAVFFGAFVLVVYGSLTLQVGLQEPHQRVANASPTFDG